MYLMQRIQGVVGPGLPDLPPSGSREPPACVFKPRNRNQGCLVSRTHGSPWARRMSHDRHLSPGTTAGGNPQGSSSSIFQRYFCSYPRSELRDGGHRGGAQVWQSPRSPCAPPLALTSRSVSNSPWRCALARLPTVTLMQSCVWVSNTPQCHTSAQVHRDGSLPLLPTTNASEQLLLLAPPPTSPCTVKVSVKGSLSLCHRPG